MNTQKKKGTIIEIMKNVVHFEIKQPVLYGQAIYIEFLNLQDKIQPLRMECEDEEYWFYRTKISPSQSLEENIKYQYFVADYFNSNSNRSEINFKYDTSFAKKLIPNNFTVVHDKPWMDAFDRLDVTPEKNLIYFSLEYLKAINYGEAIYVMWFSPNEEIVSFTEEDIKRSQRLIWNTGHSWQGTVVIKKEFFIKNNGQLLFPFVKSLYNKRMLSEFQSILQDQYGNKKTINIQEDKDITERAVFEGKDSNIKIELNDLDTENQQKYVEIEELGQFEVMYDEKTGKKYVEFLADREFFENENNKLKIKLTNQNPIVVTIEEPLQSQASQISITTQQGSQIPSVKTSVTLKPQLEDAYAENQNELSSNNGKNFPQVSRRQSNNDWQNYWNPYTGKIKKIKTEQYIQKLASQYTKYNIQEKKVQPLIQNFKTHQVVNNKIYNNLSNPQFEKKVEFQKLVTNINQSFVDLTNFSEFQEYVSEILTCNQQTIPSLNDCQIETKENIPQLTSYQQNLPIKENKQQNKQTNSDGKQQYVKIQNQLINEDNDSTKDSLNKIIENIPTITSQQQTIPIKKYVQQYKQTNNKIKQQYVEIQRQVKSKTMIEEKDSLKDSQIRIIENIPSIKDKMTKMESLKQEQEQNYRLSQQEILQEEKLSLVVMAKKWGLAVKGKVIDLNYQQICSQIFTIVDKVLQTQYSESQLIKACLEINQNCKSNVCPLVGHPACQDSMQTQVNANFFQYISNLCNQDTDDLIFQELKSQLKSLVLDSFDCYINYGQEQGVQLNYSNIKEKFLLITLVNYSVLYSCAIKYNDKFPQFTTCGCGELGPFCEDKNTQFTYQNLCRLQQIYSQQFSTRKVKQTEFQKQIDEMQRQVKQEIETCIKDEGNLKNRELMDLAQINSDISDLIESDAPIFYQLIIDALDENQKKINIIELEQDNQKQQNEFKELLNQKNQDKIKAFLF